MNTKTLKSIGKSKRSIPGRTTAHMHCSSARNPEKDVRPTNRVRPAGHSPWCAETSRSVDQLILYPSTFPLPRFRRVKTDFGALMPWPFSVLVLQCCTKFRVKFPRQGKKIVLGESSWGFSTRIYMRKDNIDSTFFFFCLHFLKLKLLR